jgi:hypothetical protein
VESFLNYLVKGITTNLDGVSGIVLRGSQRTNAVDLWSDTDLLIVLNEGIAINEQAIVEAIHALGFVVGCEMYKYSEESLLYRIAIEIESSIHLLDAQFCSYEEWVSSESRRDQPSSIIYGGIELGEIRSRVAERYSFDSYDSDNTWFKYFIAIKKFARNDNLIGLHLLLDLVRDYLVVEMIERDIRHGTNIHTFGYAEQMPPNIDLSQLDIANKKAVFEYISKLAYAYDQKLKRNVKGYISRYTQISKYLEVSSI